MSPPSKRRDAVDTALTKRAFAATRLTTFAVPTFIMTQIGTPLAPSATKVLLCGSGELGKEVVLELQRFGVETIAVDRYANAPAMQVAHRSHVINMLDANELRRVIERERPHCIVPEIEAIATTVLVELEQEGYTIIPTARAVHLTMNREGIRRLACEELGLPVVSVRLCRRAGEFSRCGEYDWVTVRRQTHHELIGQGAKRGAYGHRRGQGVALRARGGPGGWWASDR